MVSLSAAGVGGKHGAIFLADRPGIVTVGTLPPGLEIALLGPPRVRRNGEPVSFDTRKATALLAHLALAGRPRSREALCELLWPDQDPDHARGALRRTLSTLRKSVGEQWIDTAGDSVALVGDPDVDVRRFRALVAAGELAAAVDVFRGELLEGFYVRDSPGFDAWYVQEADALQRELASALGRLVRALTGNGDYGGAIRHAKRWLALDPLHEPAHRELIRLYALDGDRAAALAQYRDCVRTLSQELGVPPVDETATLFEQVSEGTLVAPAPAAPAPAPTVRPPQELPLVGRAVELAALASAYAAARPDGRLAVIEGEAGIGKSRLARELITTAGGTVLSARCHEDETRLPYGPIVELLGEAARTGALAGVPPQRLADASLLAPELAMPNLPAPMEMSGPAAQARLLEAVASVLGVADLIFVDDVHAADEATLDVLTYLARRLRGRSLLLLLAWRSDSVPPGHRLRRLEGSVLPLGRLDAAQVSELVRARAIAPDIEQQIYEESEGLPLFVAEYLAALAEGGEPGREMRELVAGRVAGLGATARQLIETAAVIGRTFTFETVRAASGRGDEETTDGLDEIVGRGLVRELDAGYDFTHGKLRELVYEQTGRARRRLLHRRVAEALLRSGGAPATAAQHLRQAGDDAGAAEQHRIAAEHAASVLAFGDALDHLDAALALGAPVHERMGDLRTLVGDYAGALASYEAAAASSDDVARVEHKLGGVHQRRGEWERAQARYTVALEACDDAGLRARILTDLSLTLHQAGEHGRAAALAAEAAQSATDPQALAQVHNVLGMLAREDGRLGEARAAFERSLALADPSGRAAALNNLALVARESGETDRALELTKDALALCVAGGDRHREAALENNLADLFHAAGRTEESMEHQLRAVAIFSEVGGDERTRLPEIWKLVSW
jgi:DNA-binding SARP family transcriptional activator/Tfp pilus assembly protein PilF